MSQTKGFRTVIIILLFVVLHLILSWVATQTIPYLGFFSYPELLAKMPFPDIIKRFASFDGLHYIKISQAGYEHNAPAFFPLYPMLMGFISELLSLHSFVVGILISLLSFATVVWLFPQVMKEAGVNNNDIHWALIFFLVFPTSFFLLSVYTESLFLLLFLASLLFIRKKAYMLAALMAFFAGTTRLVGLFVCIPLFFAVLPQLQLNHPCDFLRIIAADFRANILKYVVPISSVVGFLSYSTYLFFLTGDPLKFFHVQEEFGANRSTSLVLFPQVMYRYLKIFVTSQHNFQYFIAWVEFIIFLLVFALLLYDFYQIFKQKASMFRLGINIFSWINLLLPTFTGTFTSLPRYALISLSIYIVLAQLRSKWLQIALAILFAALHIILFMYFIQGYFVS